MIVRQGYLAKHKILLGDGLLSESMIVQSQDGGNRHDCGSISIAASSRSARKARATAFTGGPSGSYSAVDAQRAQGHAGGPPPGGRSLTRRQLTRLGFSRDREAPCHATLTETLRALDPDAIACVFSQFAVALSPDAEEAAADRRQIAIDGKKLRGSKDADGRDEHVLFAFCVALEQSLGHVSSRGKGLEIPDALRLLDKTDLTGKIVTGDAIFCQKQSLRKSREKAVTMSFP